MTISDILVSLDTSPACGERLDLTFRLAHRFGAYLIGVCPEEAAATLGPRFSTMLRQEALSGEWHAAVGLAAPYVARRAQAADLVVLGQAIPGEVTGLDAPEEVILACGRPVLMVPYAGHFERCGEHVVIAWNGSREAARAMQDALPLLTMAKSVCVLLVNPEDDAEAELAEDVAIHLARHGLPAKTEVVRKEFEPVDVAETIRAKLAEAGADLLVMGAYSHSRLREALLGGVTRDILRTMSVPVLMAH
jgi:nucleotide-binding universal stress UspA family protein